MSAPRRPSSGSRGSTQGGYAGSGRSAASSRSEGGSQRPASSQTGRSRRWPLARDDMLMPVTVKKLTDASVETDDGNCPVVNGYRPSTVTLVGRLLNPSTTGTSYQFTLHDGTGAVVCTYWLAGHGGDAAIMNIPAGDYVDVSGRPDVRSHVPSITVFSCRPVAPNFNRITHHFLAAIHAHLDLQRPPPETLVTDMYNLLRDYLEPGDIGLPFSWICSGTTYNHVVVRRALDVLVSRDLASYDPVEDKYNLP